MLPVPDCGVPRAVQFAASRGVEAFPAHWLHASVTHAARIIGMMKPRLLFMAPAQRDRRHFDSGFMTLPPLRSAVQLCHPTPERPEELLCSHTARASWP